MTYFLFTVEIPATPAISNVPSLPQAWLEFEGDTNTIAKPTKPFVKLQRNVWLIPVEGAWPFLSALASMAAGRNFSYAVSLIEGVVTPLTLKP